MKKYFVLIVLITLYSSLSLFSQEDNSTPMLFRLEWGTSYNSVKNRIINSNIGLADLKYYQIFPGRNELTDLKTSAYVKYISNGTPLFKDIPSDVIFTFYNSSGTIEGLQLSKIEVYMKKKDKAGLWINTRTIYRNLITLFCENYKILLTRDDESVIFTKYNYEVTINGIYVNIFSNMGDNRLNNDEAIFLSYENTKLQRMILQKEIQLDREREKIQEEKSEDNDRQKVKDNL